jgi:hypothetical protein
MANYLVLAQNAATSRELIDEMADIAHRDLAARFTVVVPDAAAEHLLTSDEAEGHRVTTTFAHATEHALRRAHLPIDRVRVGDASPLTAIDDELRTHPRYDAIVLATPRPGPTRWVGMDVHHRAAKHVALPLIHVIAGVGVTEGGSIPIPPPSPSRAAAMESGGGRERRAPGWWIGALMVLYLAVIGSLALGVNRGYFVLEGVALVMFTVIVGGLWYSEHPGGGRP